MSGALIVGVVALALSVASLTWQVAQFFLGGSRVVAELQHGARSDTSVALGPVRESGKNRNLLAEQGFGEQVVGVIARNKGRLAATIVGWNVVFDSGLSVSTTGHDDAVGPLIPHRLEPGEEATWLLPVQDVRAAAVAWRDTMGSEAGSARARVRLGTGRNVKSRTALPPQLSRGSRALGTAHSDRAEER